MDILQLIGQVLGILVTVLGAVWWLSTKLERLEANLDKHTTLLQAQIRSIEVQVSDLKTAVDGSHSEITDLRERTARLEIQTEVRNGQRP
jgi:predicted  nucleic acid-binding Zn-ribbon protein